MRAVNLSLAHPCYRVDLNSITKVEIDSLIMYDSKKMIRVTFFGDRKLYFPKVGASNINQLYYFTYREAVSAQKKKRLDALKRADRIIQQKAKEVEEIKDKIKNGNQSK